MAWIIQRSMRWSKSSLIVHLKSKQTCWERRENDDLSVEHEQRRPGQTGSAYTPETALADWKRREGYKTLYHLNCTCGTEKRQPMREGQMSVCVHNSIKCRPYVPKLLLLSFLDVSLRHSPFYKTTQWGVTRKYREKGMASGNDASQI